jgi:hypothetical protein
MRGLVLVASLVLYLFAEVSGGDLQAGASASSLVAADSWIQATSIGDTAIVEIPGEFFTALGQEVKRRSPYRYTYVFELANNYIGYIPDRRAFELGEYQVWTGLHSFLEPGTGEAVIAESIKLLDELHATNVPGDSR